MLDKYTVKLLKFIVRICEDGKFKVIETADLGKAVSSRADLETIKPMLKFLKDNEMIDIKYSDETKYCISVLPKGRVYVETHIGKKREISLSRRFALFIVGGSFVAACAGAVLGQILIKFFLG